MVRGLRRRNCSGGGVAKMEAVNALKILIVVPALNFLSNQLSGF